MEKDILIKLNEIIRLLRKLTNTPSNDAPVLDAAANFIAGVVDPANRLEEEVYEDYLKQHEVMNIPTPPISKRNLNKLIKTATEDQYVLQNTRRGERQVRIWRQK